MGAGLADIEALVLIALFTEGCGLTLAGTAKRTTTAALGVNGIVIFGFFEAYSKNALCYCQCCLPLGLRAFYIGHS